MSEVSGPVRVAPREAWLLVATFLVAVAGLIYELIAATVSSYLLGDSVRQFSFVLGVFLSSMGAGAWVSRYVEEALPGFVWAQIGLGLIGGFLAPVLFFSYAWLGAVALPLFAMLVAVGVLSGMEIPLIARALKEIGAPEFRFENVLTADYIGALAASIAFPIVVIPFLGLMSASLAFGCLNLLVAGLSLWLFRARMRAVHWLAWALALLVSLAALWQSERLVSVVDASLFEDDVILSEATPYQQITITRFRDRVRLFLDHSIQFDTQDEYRYHESLVHPVLSLAPRAEKVLILGGGDGMALREVLKHDRVRAVTLVDLDPRVTELFATNPELVPLNRGAFADPRATVVNRDAWRFAEESTDSFDVILIDLPDPKNITLSKLYSREFYGVLTERLSADGLMVTQAGSPLFARQAFWSVARTMAATRNPIRPGAGLWTLPYHVYVPSFGDWGFVIAAPQQHRPRAPGLPRSLRYLTPDTWAAAQVFGSDIGPVEAEVNSIRDHALVGYYNEGWDTWFR
ncbi:polyamine aminopropyltransferase [Pseudooceanicola sp. 216_PA32_1]|uniref:Polyamine aminopropyltransferase n=1 Tax=Pseudooceanicola pacificus TaxID=2676438 RepID=A0A844WD50_9RHOB|nr:polyamine aminopropyltransferase [Pseudooceanicola pacificus]MWB76679.1 polyamine aminopropyltransferase [Pseudooceanicola pacificus]